jgi:thiamine pyrophosphokinase
LTAEIQIPLHIALGVYQNSLAWMAILYERRTQKEYSWFVFIKFKYAATRLFKTNLSLEFRSNTSNNCLSPVIESFYNAVNCEVLILRNFKYPFCFFPCYPGFVRSSVSSISYQCSISNSYNVGRIWVTSSH